MLKSYLQYTTSFRNENSLFIIMRQCNDEFLNLVTFVCKIHLIGIFQGFKSVPLRFAANHKIGIKWRQNVYNKTNQINI